MVPRSVQSFRKANGRDQHSDRATPPVPAGCIHAMYVMRTDSSGITPTEVSRMSSINPMDHNGNEK